MFDVITEQINDDDDDDDDDDDVTATEVNSAFYPLWDGKMRVGF